MTEAQFVRWCRNHGILKVKNTKPARWNLDDIMMVIAGRGRPMRR